MSNFVDPMGFSLSGSSIHRIYQAGILERVAISFSRGYKARVIKTVWSSALPFHDDCRLHLRWGPWGLGGSLS